MVKRRCLRMALVSLPHPIFPVALSKQNSLKSMGSLHSAARISGLSIILTRSSRVFGLNKPEHIHRLIVQKEPVNESPEEHTARDNKEQEAMPTVSDYRCQQRRNTAAEQSQGHCII